LLKCSMSGSLWKTELQAPVAYRSAAFRQSALPNLTKSTHLCMPMQVD
jgi:hypothetical protein